AQGHPADALRPDGTVRGTLCREPTGAGRAAGARRPRRHRAGRRSRLRHGHRRVRGARRRALRDRLPQPGARPRLLLGEGRGLRMGAGKDVRLRHRVRDRHRKTAVAGRKPLVVAGPHVTRGLSAIAAYHAALEEPGVADASAEILREGQREARAVFGERPLCVSLRPNLMSARTVASVTVGSETLYGALDRLEHELLRDEDLRRQLDLDPEEERLALADPGFRAASPSSRLDGFVSDGIIRYVEYNA